MEIAAAVMDEDAIVQREVAKLQQREADETTRVWRAMMLAPDLETCCALLRGERVAPSRLDQTWVRRFGKRTP